MPGALCGHTGQQAKSAIMPGMSVSVVLGTNAVIEFDDNKEEGRFWYQVHSSGALFVFVAKGGEADRAEIVYGPAAWRSVTGNASKAF